MTAPLDHGETAIKAFHTHLDACERCRENPFDLCRVGLPLFLAAGEAAMRDFPVPFDFPGVPTRAP